MRMKLINRIKKFAQLALAFGLVSSASADQYFKFVVTHRKARNPPYEYVEVGEFALINAQGERVNRGLVKNASLSESNTFSYAGPSSTGDGEVSTGNGERVVKLFDGDLSGSSKMTVPLPSGDSDPTVKNQPVVTMRLETDDEIVAYNLASAQASLSYRIVTGWELYRSDDGQEWTLIDKRLPSEINSDPIVKNNTEWTWYNGGGGNAACPTTAYRIGGGSITSWHFLDLLASDPRRVVSSPLATGGDIILKDGDDYIHVFTNAAAASTFTAKESLNARVLVVGGGGAGGYNCAGGGGAGAVIFHPSYSITEGSVLSVQVGAGGAAPTDNVVGGSGGASVIRSDNEDGSLIYQADGGGGGATWGGASTPIAAGDGGCGGGGATAGNNIGACAGSGGVTACTMPPGATKYGCAGGRGWRAGPSDDGAGGGGGAQTAGADGANNIPGKGGDGVVCTILGGGLSRQAFGGGGGGGGSVNNTNENNPASGGTGGGGAGGYNRVNATSGEDGLGGGGGGGNGGANTDSKPANGGSGLVVIRYSTMRDRWYRLVITHRNTASTSTQGTIQLSELALFNAAGKRLNSGLVKSSEASLPVGSCSVSGGDLASPDEDVDNLFDGDGGTKLCVTSLGNAAELSPHLVITMHLATDEPVVGYNMESGKDTGKNDGMWPRAPKSWILYSSLDGEHWAAIDKRTADDDDAALKSNCTWYNSGNAEGKNAYTLTGLTPISYVASDGTQYVDTHYTPNAKTRVVLDYEMTANSGVYLFGFAGNHNGKSLYSKNAPGSPSMRVCRDDVFNTEVEISGSTDVGVRHVLDVGTTAILLDGVAQPNYPTAHPLSASCEGSAFLFALNQGWYPGPGKPWTDGAWVSMRVYSLKFYEDDELVFDAVPMLDAAGTPGLYDNVSGRFLTSANATPLLAPNCYYKVGSDTDWTGASFAKSAKPTSGWSETRGGTVIENHNVSSEYEYYVDSGLVLYTTHEAAADETFVGASLVLRGTLAMKGRGNTVTVNRLIAKGGAIGQWYSGFVQKLAGTISIAEGDSLTLGVTSPENVSDRRDLTIASAISGAGDLILSAVRVGQGTIVLLSGDNAEFTGTIKTPDEFNNPLTLRVTGDFGGTITSLPAAENVNAIAFNYDGLAGGSGLRVIGSEFPAALKTKLTLFSATTDFNQMNLPLVTFPAGQFLQASDFTVKHATSVGDSGTAFTGLAIIPNGDGTETLVANAASGIYFVTAEATAGTGTGLSWLSPLTLQEAFDKISAATSETAGQGKQYIIYLKVGTYKNTNGPWTFSPTMSWVFVKGGYSGSGLERADTACSVFDGDDERGLFSVTAITTGGVWNREIVYEQLDFRNAQTAVKIATGTAANNVGNYHQIFRRCRFINNTVPSGSSAKGSAIEVDGGWRPCWICADTCEFRGNTAFNDDGTTIWSGMQTTDNVVNSVEFVNSLFVGNRSKRRPCVAQIRVGPQNPNVIKSCTFAYNSVDENANSAGATGGIVLDEKGITTASSGEYMTMTMKNSIFYGNRCANAVGADYKSTLAAELQFLDHLMFESATGAGGYNVDCLLTGDPLFVTPLASASSEADVHLKSVGGRWNGSAWVKDDAMSPAIDAGDPASDCANELAPNGGRINLGAYGNTAKASKSVAETDAATVSSASGYSEIKQLDNGHTVLIFSNVTDAASFTVAKGGYARVLVVGGGGSGGYQAGSNGQAGGGGAGGFVESNAVMLAAGTYTVGVGKGGVSRSGETLAGESGDPSYVKFSDTLVLVQALGGGAGGAGSDKLPETGGSGGGRSYQGGDVGAPGTPGQGFAGGGIGRFAYDAGGGGGGAGSVGATPRDENYPSTNGGDAKLSDITGELRAYAGGGAGCVSHSDGHYALYTTLGGSAGGMKVGGDAYNSGVNGTGSGGGGGDMYFGSGSSSSKSGTGGSGIVVVHLYTRWDASKVTLNPNGGVSGGQDEVAAAFGSALPTLDPAKLPTRTNYTFGGYARKWWEVTPLTGNETDILTEGTGKWAYTAHAGYSLNGVFFENRLVINQTSMGNIEVNAPFVQVDRYQTGPDDWEGTQEDLLSDYASLMLQKARLDKTPKALALTITNLTEGKAYLVQILYHSGTAREKDLSVDGVNYYDCQKTGGENSNRFGWSFNLRFVASAESETINLTTHQEYLQVNAIQLREISAEDLIYYDRDGKPTKDAWDVDGDETLYAMWNRGTMYMKGKDADGKSSWVASSQPGSIGWAVSRGDSDQPVSHNVADTYDYVVVPGASMRTPTSFGTESAPLAFVGHSLTLEGELQLRMGGALSGNDAWLRIDRLIGAGGTISLYAGFKARLNGESIAIQDDSALKIYVDANRTRHLYVKPPISGAGDLILALGKSTSASERYDTILTLEGDNSGFTGAIKTIQPDDWAGLYPSKYDFYVMGGFGGTVESLPDIGSNYVHFKYDGLVGDQGLRISTNEVSDVIRERIILYSDTQDFDAEELPLMTFPEGTEVDPAAFTVRHATGTNGTGTAFIRLGVVTNSNATISLVANCAPKLPEDYTALDYLDNGSDIATAGFVQIDGFHLAGSNVVELKYNVNAEKASGYQDIFMARAYLDGQTNLDNLAEFGLGRNTVANPTQLSFTYGKRKNPTSNVVKITNVDAMYTGVDVVARLCSSQEKCLFGGVPLSGTAFPAAYTEALPCDLFIFSSADYNECNDYAHVGHANDPTLHAVALVKMYYFKVMASATDPTLLLDLIPAKRTRDEVEGFYDFVSGGFYPLYRPCANATVVDGHTVTEWHNLSATETTCGYECGVCTKCRMRISKMIPPVQGDREWRWNGQPHRPHITKTNDYWGVAGCAISYNPPNTEWTGEKTFTMTNMLVNPCVWLDGTTTNVVYTYTCLPAFFSVIRPGGPQIEVKKSWLNYAYKNIQDYDEYQKFLFETNANGVAAWQAYVLGADATPGAVANAAIVEESVQNANPETVTIKLRDWETLTPRTNENCRLAYSLLSARTTSELLANGGTVVTNKCVSPNVPYEKCQEWSFEAPLSDLTDEEPVNYYRIKVHFIFDK